MDFVYCNLSVKIGCLLQLQQAADKVDHQPKGGQQTHGGQYKKNLISIAQEASATKESRALTASFTQPIMVFNVR